jgi:hypothetical protein
MQKFLTRRPKFFVTLLDLKRLAGDADLGREREAVSNVP